jgi:hypothetical protein
MDAEQPARALFSVSNPALQPARISRIVSGGQSGVDRAALEVARSLGIPLAGWCPAGGAAEDVPDVRVLFPELRETESSDPAERTRLNVRDTDATLVLTRPGAHSPGTALTIRCAVRLGRPHLVADVDDPSAVRAWLERLGRAALNVAGPRESQAPGIHDQAQTLLEAVFGSS